MKPSDEAARKARAKEIHEQIEELTAGKKPTPAAPDSATEGGVPASPPHESPREFIHRRMRELKKQEPDS